MGVTVAIDRHGKTFPEGGGNRFRRRRRRPASSGMTMLELLIVLAVIGVVAALTAPSLATLLGSIRFEMHYGLLVRDLNLTRGEAVKRGKRVVMQVTDSLWASGWRIFEDNDNDDVYDEVGDEELMVRAELTGVTLSSTNFSSFIRYTASGASNTTGNFVLESTDASSKEVVCIGGTGRLKLSQCPSADDPCELVDPCP